MFARISPEEKLQLIGLYQEAGWIVGMTGDGVNDAPALKKADIGIVMGQRGTEVAREASDMVLKDDAFATLVAAIEHGRTIFSNIRRFIVYLLSGNLAEIMAVAAAALIAFAIALGPMQLDSAHAVTIGFLTFGFARLWHVLNMRGTESSLLVNEVTRNRYVWIAIAIGVALLIAATYVAPLAAILSIQIPTLGEWLLILSFSLLPLILVQLGKLVVHRLIRPRRAS
ncbi:MAG: HAD-IC family P-type ATPase [Halochromatium sp.]|uniref:HAD-IC family P-type ATPase n=1 Tax=Halochromatium sp. TaxID=2049430 RepID=UPI00397B4E19